MKLHRFEHREEKIYQKYRDINKSIPVNEQQHSFDTDERQEAYVKSQYPVKEDYEKYLLYREEWYRRPKDFDPGDFPLAVGIELVSSCNLNCSMCYTITDEFQDSVVGTQRMLPYGIVTKIIDECVNLGVYSILLSWRGESTLYKSKLNGRTYRFTDVLKYAKSKGILEITFLTNGQLIDENMAKEIIEAEPNWINFSIDGLGQTYNNIRTPKAKSKNNYNAFDVVTNNIKRLIKYRDEKGLTKPQLRSNTIYPSISENPDEYHNYMKDIGIGWVTVNEILDFRGSGIDGEELPEEAILDEWMCQYPFQRLMISSNGTIFPCTGAHNEEQSLVLGRYKGSAIKTIKNKNNEYETIEMPEMTLKEAWNSQQINAIRNAHQNGNRKLIKACRNCRHGAKKHGVKWVPKDWDLKEMKWHGKKFRT